MSPGVYFDLEDKDYFGGTALGSTDLSDLARFPADWWYGSNHNPDRQGEHTKAMDFGKALHALILQGREAFDKLVVVSPYPDFRTKEAQGWKAERVAEGKAILTASEIQSAEHMAALVANHPDLAAIQRGLTELAVFWRCEESGLLFRAKFDAILPGFCVDLKTYGGANTQGRDARDTALRMIAMRHYDVQRAHYEEARQALRKLVAVDAIYGGTPEQLAMLREIASRVSWAWVWVFYQKIDHKAGHAPVVMPVAVQPGDASMRTGTAKRQTAIQNYRAYESRFGLETPWAQINPLTWIEDHDFVPWMGDVPAPQSFPDLEQAA